MPNPYNGEKLSSRYTHEICICERINILHYCVLLFYILPGADLEENFTGGGEAQK